MKGEEKKDLETRFMRIWTRLPQEGEWEKFMVPVHEERKKEAEAQEELERQKAIEEKLKWAKEAYAIAPESRK